MAKNIDKKSKNNKTFFKDFKAELKRVVWPTPKQLANSTLGVVIIVIITAAIVFALDVTFEGFNKYGINKLKGIVSTQSQTNNTTNENVQDNNTSNENAASNNVNVAENTNTGQ